MTTVLVLAMHGAPPLDFPQDQLLEFMGLHHRLEHQPAADPRLAARLAALDNSIRSWPRTAANDPFHAASLQMGTALSAASGCQVFVGFNEFCAPDLQQAFEQAAAVADRVVVLTPMLTRGGEHAEKDIPAEIEIARERFPQVTFEYAWPFDLKLVAGFLAEQLKLNQHTG